MPVTSLFARLASIRRVVAIESASSFEERLTAARGDEQSVRRLRSALHRAADRVRHGGLSELRRMLGA